MATIRSIVVMVLMCMAGWSAGQEVEVKARAGTLWAINLLGSSQVKFCWKDAYGRGVGTPLGCAPGLEEDAALCYPPCKSGYSGAGPLCWQECPPDFRNTGVDCLKPAPYGRGAGYVIWDEGKCDSENPIGCEKYGLMWYPKCKPGFHNVGCCICSPDCPDDMTDVGISCQKHTYGRGVGKVITTCPSGKVEDALLCYEPCKTDFNGVGPVCWGQCDIMQPTDCGAGCASDTDQCFASIWDMVDSVFQLAVNIIEFAMTDGVSTAEEYAEEFAKEVIKSAVEAAIKAAEAELDQALKKDAQTKLSNAIQQSYEKLYNKYHDKVVPILDQYLGDETLAEQAFHNASMNVAVAAVSSDKYDLLDFVEDALPFGAGAVVKAFDKPVCDMDVPPTSCSAFGSVCVHGSCNSDGSWECQCFDGYTGPDCSEAVTTSVPSSSSEDEEDDFKLSSSGISSGSAAGIAVGVVAATVLIAAAVFMVIKHRANPIEKLQGLDARLMDGEEGL